METAGSPADPIPATTADERLRLALESARMGVWEWDMRTNELLWSEGIEPVLGLAPDEVGTGTAYFDIVHPEDRPAVVRRGTASRRDQREVYGGEHRIYWKDGSVRWVAGTGRLYYDEDGRPRSLLGTLMDITARKHAEAELIETDALLRQFITHAPAAVAMFDTDFRYLQTSDRWLVVCGLEGRDLTGKSYFELFPRTGEHWREPFRRAIAGEVVRCDEDRFDGNDGAPVWTEWEMRPWYRGDASIGGVIMFSQIVTDRIRAEEKLRASEEIFRSAMEYSPIGMALVAPEGRWLEVNPALCRLVGYGREELLATDFQSITHPDDLDADLDRVREMLLRSIDTFQMEKRYIHKDGHIIWAQLNVSLVWNADDTPHYFIAQIQDISERKQAEQALRESNAKLQAAMEVAGIGYWEYDAATDRMTVGADFLKIHGAASGDGGRVQMSRAEYVSRFMPPGEGKAVGREIAAIIAATDELSREVEIPLLRADGSRGHILARYAIIRDEAGNLAKISGASLDISARRSAEAAAEQHRRRSDAIVESAMDGIITIDADECIVVFNPAAERMFRCPAAAVFGGRLDRLIPDHAITVHTKPGESPSPPFPAVDQFRPMTGRRADGEMFPIEGSIAEIEIDGQQLLTITCRDVSERQLAERALRESEERLRQLADNLREAVWIEDRETGTLLYVSPAYEALWGQDASALRRNPRAWLEAIHPEDRERMAQVTNGAPDDSDEEYRIVRPDGSVRWIHARVFPIRDATGRSYRLAGVAEDVTDRRRIEDQFRHAQKMEAVGRLAGGVAHDFNNIIGAILMNAEIAARQPEASGQVGESLREIISGAERAANLTRQLLQFGRRNVMQPQDIDLNGAVASLAKMLRRVLREDVRIEIELEPAPLITRADPSMLDQILVNLAVNAGDAMQDGGRLTIRTSARNLSEREARAIPDATAGEYVCLTVADSGSGIRGSDLPRIFEPFFTTKEAGKGTGLGLATVFAIVQQHHGAISVSSVEGAGTTFEILLPSSHARAVPAVERAVAPECSRGNETILVAEDDPGVRTATRIALQRQGYNVLTAVDGVEALRLWEARCSEIDLLLTDLVMPGGIGGRELAARVRAESPRVKVILFSGYSPDVFGPDLEFQEGENFLQKPVSLDRLLETIRRCLGSSEA